MGQMIVSSPSNEKILNEKTDRKETTCENSSPACKESITSGDFQQLYSYRVGWILKQ